MKLSLGLLLCVLSLSIPVSGQDIPDFYLQIDSLFSQNKFQECVNLRDQVDIFIQQRKDTLGNNALIYIADSYYKMGDKQKAIEWSEKQHTYLASTSLTEEFSTALFNLSNLYFESGLYEQAARIGDELLAVDRTFFGEGSADYVTTVINVTDFYLKADRLADSKALLKSVVKRHKRGSLEYALLMNKLGDLYTYTGEYSRALSALNGALDVFKKDTSNQALYASASANLGILLMGRGKYPEAEVNFERALNDLSMDSVSRISTLNSQALAYQSMGQYDLAEKILLEIENQYKLTVGESHPNYAVAESNLSMVYNDEGKFAEAEKSILKAIEIQRASGNTKSISYARKLNNLAKIYAYSGSPEKSIPYYLESLEIIKNTLGENNADYATHIYNLGLAYLKTSKREEGIKLVRKSTNIRASVLGKRHPKYAESLEKIAEYQWQRRQRKSARATYGEVFDNYYFQIETFFPVLTEEEKAKFYYATLKPTFDKFNSFAIDFYREDGTVASDVYNIQLNTKAVVMLATEQVKNAIIKSNNAALIEKFNEWQALKEKIAKLFSQNENPAKTDSLVATANQIEKELGRESADFAARIIKRKTTWQDIQKTLKPNEAAIEVVRYNTFTTAQGGKFNDRVSYIFLIVTTETKEHPDLILMEEGNDMEGRSFKFYRNSIRSKTEDVYSYAAYFEPIGDYLSKYKINTVYFSPDGVFNQLNLNTIFNPSTSNYVNDEYTIIQVTNTSELVDRSIKKSKSTSSILIGFPTFNIAEKDSVAKTLADSDTEKDNSISRSLRGGLMRFVSGDQGIPPLPGTEKEIEEISKILSRQAKVFTTESASEWNTKRVENPKILHIATHGYFLEDEKNISNESSNRYIANPLLRSGLILAGVENFLRSGISVDSTGDDGILTAYEALNLDINDTDLVVLSACETARGEVKNGEGVYGLQRSFKLGGAKCIVMSLWSVDDEATLQLMVSFYENFLKSNNAHEAMRNAQNKIKERYPHPYYWGAFITVGL